MFGPLLKITTTILARAIMLVLALTVGSSQAFGYSQVIERTYPFGPRDSYAMVKSIALEDIRIVASNDAGTVVVRDGFVSGSDYSEALQIVSATLVNLSIVEERQYVDDAGTHFLSLKVLAELDDQLLIEKAQAVYQNKESREVLDRLVTETERLQRMLSDRLSSSQWSVIENSAYIQSNVLATMMHLSVQRNNARMVIDSVEAEEYQRIDSERRRLIEAGFEQSYTDIWESASTESKVRIMDIQATEQGVELILAITRPHSVIPYLSALYGQDVTFDVGIRSQAADIATLLERKMLAEKVSFTETRPVSLSIELANVSVSVPYFGVYEDIVRTSFRRLRPVDAGESRLSRDILLGVRSQEQVSFMGFDDPPAIHPSWIAEWIGGEGDHYLSIKLDEHQFAMLDGIDLQYVIESR